MTMIKITNNNVDAFFKNQDNVKNIVNDSTESFINSVTGELIVYGTYMGIYTDYFKDAWQETSSRIEDGERVYYVARNNERAKVFTKVGHSYDDLCVLGNDNNYDIVDEKRCYKFEIEREEGEFEDYDIYFEDESKSIVLND